MRPATIPPKITRKSGSSTDGIVEPREGRDLGGQERERDRFAVGQRHDEKADREEGKEEIAEIAHGSVLLSVQAVAEQLAGLEERDMLLLHVDRFAGAGVATRPRVALLDREGPEAPAARPGRRAPWPR
jgi:hypothetical protein